MLQKKDPLNLSGKVAVITVVGSGIGEGTAELLSAYGCAVAIVDVSDAGKIAAEELHEAGRKAEFFRCDVRDELDIDIFLYFLTKAC